MTGSNETVQVDAMFAALVRALSDHSDDNEHLDAAVPDFVELDAEEQSALDELATGFVDRLLSGWWPFDRLAHAVWHDDRTRIRDVFFGLISAYAGKAKALIKALTPGVVDNHSFKVLLVRSLITLCEHACPADEDFRTCFLRTVYRETVADLGTPPPAGRSTLSTFTPAILDTLRDETVSKAEIVRIVECALECLENQAATAGLVLSPSMTGSQLPNAPIGAPEAEVPRRTTHDVQASPAQGTRRGRMLVLSRKRDESIAIGDNIVVTVVGIQGGRVRLGVEAPRERSIHRSEVYAAIRSEHANESATERSAPRRTRPFEL